MTQRQASGPRRNATIAFALGAFCVLGFAPFAEYFTAYIAVSPAPTFALAGLFLLWRKAATAREAMGLGLAWGAGCFLFGVL